jgi:propionate CoA-transferase
MAIENKIEAYNLPQGVLSQLFRDIAGHKIGAITHVGLNTFADPRIEGGKLNSITKEDIVEVVTISGQEKLLYKPIPVDIAFIRGSYADENGNVTVEREVASLEATSIAQAAKNSGGKVVVQVEKVVSAGTLDPKLVKVPGIYVDAIVVTQDKADHAQCVGCEYDGAMTGDVRAPLSSLKFPPLDAKKIIGRRAVMELTANTVVKLGIGIPEYISMVANEEGIGDYMTLTVEAGPVGGVPQGGPKFGGSVNPDAILDQAYQFDFYDGGGVDLAFLGLAQADKSGNINVSKFGPRIAGCGGFVNITQNAKKVFFCGTFTADGLKTKVADGKLLITQEGKERKFIDKVEQITFSGEYAVKTRQPVLYITERAVFELRADGVYLIEVAPGIDVKTQVTDLMGFVPKMEGTPKLMDARIFVDALMGLKN